MSAPEKVWIVTSGEAHEGCNIIKTCGTLEKAREIAQGFMDQQSHRTWQQHGSDSNEWISGCDYVSIEEQDVF